MHSGEEQLFDLVNDPGERKNLSKTAAYHKQLSDMRQRMVEHLQERGEEFVKNGKLVTRDSTLLYSPNYPKE